MSAPTLAGRPIVVGLDGSELAERALPYALALADALRDSIVLVTATSTPEIWNEVPVPADYEMGAKEYATTYLEGVRRELGRQDVTTDVRSGFARDEVLTAAADHNAGIIVLASHGRSGVSRWVYGSLVSHVTRESQTPVFVVGNEPLEADPPRTNFLKIMVPLDGSDVAEAALPPALELATALGASITLIRSVPWAVEAYPYAAPAIYTPEIDESLAAGAQTYLDRVKAALKTNINVTTAVMRGPAAATLLAYSEEENVDLVVTTTHARAGLTRAVLGSTADRLLHGRAPVLLIRPAD